MAADPAGNLYYYDYMTSNIEMISAAAGQVSTLLKGGGPDSADGALASTAKSFIAGPIAVDGAGQVYFTDTTAPGTVIVRKIDTAGYLRTVAGTGQGNTSDSGDGGLATLANLGQVLAFTVDSSGNVFVATYTDAGGARVRRVDAVTHIIATYAGNGTRIPYTSFGTSSSACGWQGGPVADGVPANSAALGGVNALATDSSGNLYIADGGGTVIRRIDAATGVISTVAGVASITGPAPAGDGGPALAAQFQTNLLSVDSAGNIYLVDNFQNPCANGPVTSAPGVRRILAASGNIETVMGGYQTARSGYWDNVPGIGSGFGNFLGLATGLNDFVYFSADNDDLMRQYAPTEPQTFVPVTFSIPTGAFVRADSFLVSNGQTVSWPVGSPHSLAASSQYYLPSQPFNWFFFTGWSFDGTGASEDLFTTPASPVTVYPNYEQTTQLFPSTFSPSGPNTGGSVSVSPSSGPGVFAESGVSYGLPFYAIGSTVQVTATPSAGMVFENFMVVPSAVAQIVSSYTYSSSNPLTLTLNAATTVQANFGPPLPSLNFSRTASSQPAGTVSVSITNIGLGPAVSTQIAGVSIKLLTPASGTSVTSTATLPISLGTIAVNGTASFVLPVNWPAAAKRFTVTFSVTCKDSDGNSYSFTPSVSAPY